MDSIPLMVLHIPNPLNLCSVLSHARPVSRGDIVIRYPTQSIPLILVVIPQCFRRLTRLGPSVSILLCYQTFIALLYHSASTVRLLYFFSIIVYSF
jgi:hypothetical protein